MDLTLILQWIQNNLLAIVALILTIVFIYHYMIERDHGVKLSKKYRHSIYEAQSKIFLNASQYLISGNKDLAIRELQSAVDINRETIDTYFALGRLFRANGEIEKAIGIHRSLIARNNISEGTRLEALKELGIDFDKGGFFDKAIETYKDVLKINRDQFEVILALCRIYEDVADWDEAYNYRIMLSKVHHENQSETISHILVEKAKKLFEEENYKDCIDDLEDAFRFAPSVSANILKLKLSIVKGNIEEAKILLMELLKQHPLYATFIFVSLEDFNLKSEKLESYRGKLEEIKSYFLELKDTDLNAAPSVILSKVRLLKTEGRNKEAINILEDWTHSDKRQSEVLQMEYVKLLIEVGKVQEALKETHKLLEKINSSLTRHFCSNCGYNSDEIFWRCPQCYNWETIQFRWKV
jgi:lipopolysaccharide assembly protein B